MKFENGKQKVYYAVQADVDEGEARAPRPPLPLRLAPAPLHPCAPVPLRPCAPVPTAKLNGVQDAAAEEAAIAELKAQVEQEKAEVARLQSGAPPRPNISGRKFARQKRGRRAQA